METENEKSADRERLSGHILPASGTMIGICVTLIGLVKVVETRTSYSHVDEYAALTTLLFLGSAVASYISIRGSGNARASRKLETAADQCFLAGLFGIVLIAIFFAYEII